MGDVERARVAVVFVLLLVGAAAISLDWPATLTDEDDTMGYWLADLAAGRDPYATEHRETRTVVSPFGSFTYAWATPYPYLPALVVLQLPVLDYRWTALAAYGLMLLALRDRALPFFAFANPLVLWLAASGFNDFVPLALLAWADRLGRPWLAWVACGAKQWVLPVVLVERAVARDGKGAALAVAGAAVVIVPFVLWDPAAFWAAAVVQHVPKTGSVWRHWNYALYPLWLLTAGIPAARRRVRPRSAPARSA